MFRICSGYNEVQLNHIHDFQRRYRFQVDSSSIFERLKRQTDAFYNAFKAEWDQENGPCTMNSTGEKCCQGQRIEVFERNNVSVCSALSQHMLTIFRCL
jgi:hypothetical protein